MSNVCNEMHKIAQHINAIFYQKSSKAAIMQMPKSQL